MYIVTIVYLGRESDEVEFEYSSHATDYAKQIAQEGVQIKRGDEEWVYYPAHRIHAVFIEKKKK